MPADRTGSVLHRSSDSDDQTPQVSQGLNGGSIRSVTPSVASVVEDDAVSCQRCRQRKKRCNRGKPHCASCVRSKVDCTYPADRPASHVLSSSMAEIGRLRKRCMELEAKVELLSTSAQPASVSPTSAPPLSTNSQSLDLPYPFSQNHNLVTALHTRPTAPRLAEKVLARLLTKQQDVSSSFGGTIGQELGITPDEEEMRLAGDSRLPLWPSLSAARELLELYHARSYTMLPIVDRAVLENDLRTVYDNEDESQFLDPNNFTSPDPRIFRLGMVFAIAQELAADKPLLRYQVTANMLHAVALRHLPGALQETDLTAIACVALLVQISIMEFVKMAPHYVVSVAASMAIEVGLHHDNPSLSLEEQDASRRIFWTIFCMDRNISFMMGKPVCIPESIITTRLPIHVEGGSTQSDHMSPTLFFCQMVFLRRLQGTMLDAMRLASKPADPEAVFVDLRNKIDEWWANTAGPPLPHNLYAAPVPFLELQYNLLLVYLYRPSRLFVQTHPFRMPILRSAACKSLQLYREFISSFIIPHNYVHMYSIVLCGVSLLYVLGESEGDVRNLDITSWRSKALADIDASQSLISTYCEGWPWVTRFRASFQVLADKVRARIFRTGDGQIFNAWSTFNQPMVATSRQDVSGTAHIQPAAPAHTNGNSMANPATVSQTLAPAQPQDDGTNQADVWSLWVAGLADLPAIGTQNSMVTDDVEAFLSSLGLSDLTSLGFEDTNQSQ